MSVSRFEIGCSPEPERILDSDIPIEWRHKTFVQNRIDRAILAEIERCARIAEGLVFGCEGTPEGIEIARLIRGEK